MELNKELTDLRDRITKYAQDFGLDFFPVQFEMLDYRTMNEIAAYDGFPMRYPHWRFGMEYERLSKSYAYGLHRIYEMVINTDPCIAYLLVSNELVDQKLVIAHVYGHSDFFKNNLWFSHTNRRMLDEMANHASRVRRYIDKHGLELVEAFLDACLSLENLIDVHQAGIQRHRELNHAVDGLDRPVPVEHKMPAKEYMDSYINPPEYLAAQQRKQAAQDEQDRHNPPEPERDVLLFLLENAPLENWQHDLLEIVREEAYYFAPQRQSKIMNEGWAVFAHTHIMTQYALEPNELIDYADHHSGTVAVSPGRLNPYKIGYELYLDIEDRWNRGAFGPEYEACENFAERRKWDKKLGIGREKVFEVRRIYNDVGFIDEFMTEDFVRQHNLFGFDFNPKTNLYEISSRDFAEIKRRMLFQLTNFGQPVIDVVDGNYQNRGALYLVHRHEGMDLDIPWARETLQALYLLWGRPVYIETVVGEGDHMLYGYGPDGSIKHMLDEEEAVLGIKE
jgi:stage V sporulation protein R